MYYGLWMLNLSNNSSEFSPILIVLFREFIECLCLLFCLMSYVLVCSCLFRLYFSLGWVEGVGTLQFQVIGIWKIYCDMVTIFAWWYCTFPELLDWSHLSHAHTHIFGCKWNPLKCWFLILFVLSMNWWNRKWYKATMVAPRAEIALPNHILDIGCWKDHEYMV